MNDAGRIGFLIKGNYLETETYDFLDIVYYDGNSYVAKKKTRGNVPVEKNEYWQIFATGGGGGGTTNYDFLENKPQINGVKLQGDVSFADLKPSYKDLTNKPKSLPANGGTADKLSNERTFQTNLESTEATEFNGTENNIHGVIGVLPIEHGGTGNKKGDAASVCGVKFYPGPQERGPLTQEEYEAIPHTPGTIYLVLMDE